MKKLLVSDYDDTFYINDRDILKNIKLVNENKSNFMFVIATGRSYYDFNKKKDLYNIESKYVILNHGASIIKDNELISNIIIDKSIIKSIINDLELDKSLEYFACSGLDSRVDINNEELTKIHIKYATIYETKEKTEELNTKYGNYINCYLVSKKYAIEIVSKKANKKDAILEIMELENINKDNVYTIGNGSTDAEMLKYFNGYAMKYSDNIIKKLNLKTLNSVSELINIIINVK